MIMSRLFEIRLLLHSFIAFIFQTDTFMTYYNLVFILLVHIYYWKFWVHFDYFNNSLAPALFPNEINTILWLQEKPPKFTVRRRFMGIDAYNIELNHKQFIDSKLFGESGFVSWSDSENECPKIYWWQIFRPNIHGILI